MALVMRLERRPWIAAAILLVVAFSTMAVMLQSGTGYAEGTCPTGAPSSTPTATPTSTATPTPTPTPPPTDTPTPTPLPSLPTGTPTLPGQAHAPRAVGGDPSDPTPVPDPCSTSISLSATPSSGVWGTSFALSGTLTCVGGPIASQTVTLKKKPAGSNVWQAVTSDSTDSDGLFRFPAQQPSVNTTYAVSFAGDTLCNAVQSGGLLVQVRPGVAFNVAANGQPQRGQSVTFAGRVAPGHAGHRVVLQVLQGGGWQNAVAVTLYGSSTYRVSYRRNGSGMLLFRMAYPSQHADHAWNVGRRIAVTWR